MRDQQRRDETPPYNQTTSNAASHDQSREYDDPSQRQDEALGQQQLTAREREERWPIG